MERFMRYQTINLTLTLLVVIATSPSLNAKISSMANELLGRNYQVVEGQLEVDLAQLDLNAIRANKGWGVAYNYSYDNNSLEGSNSFNFHQTTTNAHTLSLTQTNFLGGTFSLSNTLSMVDQGNIDSSLRGSSSTDVNQYIQSLSYKQNLGRNRFGREDRANLTLAKEGVELKRLTARLNDQQILMKLSQSYLSAKLHNSLKGLQQRAHTRALKRRALILRRVKDGVALNVDLVQAKISVLGKEEAIKSALNALNSSLEQVGELLHRKVDFAEVGVFDMEKETPSTLPTADWSKSFIKRILDQRQLISNRRLSRVDFSFAPTMDITAGIKGNEYDSKIGESLANGTILDQDREITVAFNLSFDLGSDAAKVERARERVNLSKLVLNQQVKQTNFQHSFEMISSRVKRTDENIISIRGRRRFAREVVKEYGKLYQLGKATLDQVIGAEERLIDTEISLVRSLVEREGLVISLAALSSNVKEYLATAAY
jgi:outer membrane protein